MTLLIAYMLLWHFGDADAFHWIGVTLLWFVHIVVAHDAPSSSQIRRIIQEEMRK